MKKLFKKENLTGDQKKHRKRIKTYSRSAYNIRSNVTRFQPTDFEKSAIQIANHLMNHKSAIVDFNNIDSARYQRLIDFISGSVYCLGGSIDKLKNKLYLITPSSVNVKDSDGSDDEFEAAKLAASEPNSIDYKEETIEEDIGTDSNFDS